MIIIETLSNRKWQNAYWQWEWGECKSHWAATRAASIAVRGTPAAWLPRLAAITNYQYRSRVNADNGMFVSKVHSSILVMGNGSGSCPIEPSLAQARFPDSPIPRAMGHDPRATGPGPVPPTEAEHTQVKAAPWSRRPKSGRPSSYGTASQVLLASPRRRRPKALECGAVSPACRCASSSLLAFGTFFFSSDFQVDSSSCASCLSFLNLPKADLEAAGESD
jgi:hypothetical protein